MLFKELDADQKCAYAFVYATQRPLSAMLMRLSLGVRDGVKRARTVYDVVSEPLCMYEHEFIYENGEFVQAKDLGWVTADGVKVIANVLYLGGCKLASDDAPMPLDDFLRLFADRSVRAAPDAAGAKPKVVKAHLSARLVEDCEWLAEYLLGGGAPPSRAASSSDPFAVGAVSGERPMREAAAADLDEVVVADVWKRLDERRRKVGDEEAPDDDHFYVQVRGGAWTATHRGKAYDSVCGLARGGTPREFCKAYSLSEMSSYACDKFGEDGSTTLAREWCQRMEHVYSIWMVQDSWDYSFTEDDVNGYMPRDELVASLFV